jgi:formylglycine-generating enzyme required for sulfatase activity
LKHLPPPFEWCFVPAGEVVLATNPPKLETVAEFAIAKYTITNAQFQVFVESRDGYMYEKDYRWYNFSEKSREYRLLNPKPRTMAFMDDDLPRTNLSWFDAIAFSRWLSNRAGQSITLPTEQQWQLAAIGDNDWQYPWGNKFDVARCNTKESGIGRPVSVTEYPNGASPYGVFQMCGNVYDWCVNNYHEPDDTKLDSVTSERAVRGGSWVNPYNSTPVVTHRRDAKPANNTNNNVGFRVLLVLPVS